eukprot:m.32316 g.32316  ORF g.32316 m.32316 type:complete len:165 (-) comp4881_c0_seq1:212-706(-)
MAAAAAAVEAADVQSQVWPRSSWFVGPMNRVSSEKLLSDEAPGVFLVRVIPKRKQVLSVRYGESAVVHFLIEKDRAEAPYTINGEVLGSCHTLEAIITRIRHAGTEFEIALEKPLRLKASGALTSQVEDKAKAPTQSIARTAAVGGQRRASIKLTDKKSLPCIT